MVCPEGCGRGSARVGSAAVGHPRLLAGGTKEEEKGEEDIAVLGLEGGRRGWGPSRAKSSCSWQLLPRAAGARPGAEAPGEGEVRSSRPDCCAVPLEPGLRQGPE
jgi:hypothetical protein